MALNGLTPIAVDEFGGLNLAIDPTELQFNGAIDLINVQLDRTGTLSQRAAAVRRFDTPAATAPASLMAFHSATSLQPSQVLVGSDTGVYAYDSAGVFLGSTTFGTINPHGWFGMTTFGTPTASWAFAGNGIDDIQRWDGTSWTSPAVTLTGFGAGPLPKAGLLAVTPWDNRLIATGFAEGVTNGGPGGQANSSNRSMVWFSDPGDPLTWQGPGPPAPGGGNWLMLSPGDGEPITGLAVWQNYVFIFKRTKFFVFYGVSSDATGKPVFNYRTVSGGMASGMTDGGAVTDYSAQGMDPQGVAVGPDGVYFTDRSGIWRTNGSTPIEISKPIRRFFQPGGGYPFWTSPVNSFSYPRSMVFHKGRLYASFQTSWTGNAHGLLVFDGASWMVWDVPVRALATWSLTLNDSGFVAFSKAGSSGVFSFDYTLPDDYPTGIGGGAVPINWYYQTGFSDLGAPSREKTVRETEIVGRGTSNSSVQLAWARDLQAPDSPQGVQLDATRGNRGLDRHARVGELLSFRLSNTAAATVNRVVAMLREERGVGEKMS